MKTSTINVIARSILVALILIVLAAILFFGISYAPRIAELGTIERRIELQRENQNAANVSIAEMQQRFYKLPEEIYRTMLVTQELLQSQLPRQLSPAARSIIARVAKETLAGHPTSVAIGRIFALGRKDGGNTPADAALLDAAAAYTDYFTLGNHQPRRALTTLVALRRNAGYAALADAARTAILFDHLDAVNGWGTLRPDDRPSAGARSAALGIATAYNTVLPLTTLGNFQRRLGNIDEAFETFELAGRVSREHGQGAVGDIYHGMGTQRLAQGIRDGDRAKIVEAGSFLDRAIDAKRAQGQTRSMVDGSRENKALVLLAQGQYEPNGYKEALALSNEIEAVNTSAWNVAVLCVSAERRQDGDGEDSCRHALSTLDPNAFRATELRGLMTKADWAMFQRILAEPRDR